jgi:hypothetical protein
MAQHRESRRENRRKNRRAEPNDAVAPSTPARAGSSLWVLALAALGGAAIAGAVVFEMQDEKPPAQPSFPTSPASLPVQSIPGQSIPGQGAAPTYTPAPPGEAPPGKVWHPEHGHWHDITPGVGPQ